MIRKSIIWSIVCLGLLTGCAERATHRAHQVVAIETRLQLGKAYLAERNLPAAKYHFQKILLAEPHHSEAHLGMALHEQYAGRPETASQHYRMAMQYAARNDTVVHHYAIFLCEQKQYEKAEQLIKENREGNTRHYHCDR
ncbi:fimbrial assembly protein [Xenorhabdus sp. DI]|uniref:tetratricopeptide repeat protein n=1 Tax=Xenorhabdus doucetiae TaxID=351671 RepID=UPI00198AEF19|nr:MULTISPECIES: tetratricopeptide repeat protein [unclassified Xenorhabdus]MBD2784985.1 fimbrial assembly protein [Xenorhabdus sp. 3]MBD2787126.1 fimbrial assembly protein [Xenorhabdus sp. DI]